MALATFSSPTEAATELLGSLWALESSQTLRERVQALFLAMLVPQQMRGSVHQLEWPWT